MQFPAFAFGIRGYNHFNVYYYDVASTHTSTSVPDDVAKPLAQCSETSRHHNFNFTCSEREMYRNLHNRIDAWPWPAIHTRSASHNVCNAHKSTGKHTKRSAAKAPQKTT
jgi:hypothetical protein